MSLTGNNPIFPKKEKLRRFFRRRLLIMKLRHSPISGIVNTLLGDTDIYIPIYIYTYLYIHKCIQYTLIYIYTYISLSCVNKQILLIAIVFLFFLLYFFLFLLVRGHQYIYIYTPVLCKQIIFVNCYHVSVCFFPVEKKYM